MALLKCVICLTANYLIVSAFVYSVDAAAKIHRAGPRPTSKAGINPDEIQTDYNPWFYSLFGTLLVGLTGIFPLLVIPVEAGHKLREGGKFFKENSITVLIEVNNILL